MSAQAGANDGKPDMADSDRKQKFENLVEDPIVPAAKMAMAKLFDSTINELNAKVAAILEQNTVVNAKVNKSLVAFTDDMIGLFKERLNQALGPTNPADAGTSEAAGESRAQDPPDHA